MNLYAEKMRTARIPLMLTLLVLKIALKSTSTTNIPVSVGTIVDTINAKKIA